MRKPNKELIDLGDAIIHDLAIHFITIFKKNGGRSLDDLTNMFWEQRDEHVRQCGGPDCFVNDTNVCNAVVREITHLFKAEISNHMSRETINKLFDTHVKKKESK